MVKKDILDVDLKLAHTNCSVLTFLSVDNNNKVFEKKFHNMLEQANMPAADFHFDPARVIESLKGNALGFFGSYI